MKLKRIHGPIDLYQALYCCVSSLHRARFIVVFAQYGPCHIGGPHPGGTHNRASIGLRRRHLS